MKTRAATFIVTILCLAHVVTANRAVTPQRTVSSSEKQRRDAEPGSGITGAVSCWAYGYKVKMLINDADIGITGGKSESRRLLSADHGTGAAASSKLGKASFALKPGANRVSIQFDKLSSSEDDRLEIVLESNGYPAPLLFLYSKSRPAGRLERTINIHHAVPEAFEPVFVSDEGEERSAFVHLNTPNCTITPSLNGKDGLMLSMPGSVALEGVRAGKNELSLKWTGETNKEMRFAIITPEWTRFFVRQSEDCTEKVETFTFIAK